jgi:hypothetical protein
MILLRIGYVEILLKNETGIQQLMKTLSEGLEVGLRSYENPPRMEIKGPIRLAMEIVSDKGWVFRKKGDGADDQPAEPGTDLVPAGLRSPPAGRASGKLVPSRSLFPQ